MVYGPDKTWAGFALCGIFFSGVTPLFENLANQNVSRMHPR